MRRNFPVFRKMLLLTGDLVLLISATYLSFFILFPNNAPQSGLDSFYNLIPVTMIAATCLLNINGLLSLARKNFSALMMSLAVTLFKLLIVIMAAGFLFKEFAFPRSVLILSVLLQFIFIVIWKYLFWRAEKALIVPKNVLLIGSRAECERIILRLNAYPQLNYNVKYVCTDCEHASWKEFIQNIDLVIITSDLNLKSKANILDFCHTTGKQIFLIPDSYELFCFNIEMDKIDDIPVFRAKYLKPTLEQRILKRAIDLTVSIVALALLWPVFITLAIVIKITSRGPVFYSQIRTGRDEQVFSIYKFRTMVPNAEEFTGPVLATEKDPRITFIGRLMRATRLDELPQLINVLIGDMSIVGPRPERPFFVEQFKQEIPGYHYRHNVKPGITGMAQVHGKYNTLAYDKLVYDLIYIQKCSIVTDLIIMLQTVRVLLSKSSTEGKKVEKKIDLAKYEITHVG